jgi:hypothetical protein
VTVIAVSVTFEARVALRELTRREELRLQRDGPDQAKEEQRRMQKPSDAGFFPT